MEATQSHSFSSSSSFRFLPTILRVFRSCHVHWLPPCASGIKSKKWTAPGKLKRVAGRNEINPIHEPGKEQINVMLYYFRMVGHCFFINLIVRRRVGTPENWTATSVAIKITDPGRTFKWFNLLPDSAGFLFIEDSYPPTTHRVATNWISW